MTDSEVIEQLKAYGTEQNRKIYRRHGVAGDLYGVSYSNLGKLKKAIKIDHDLAEKLWATGNQDARVLATMIADSSRASDRLLNAWAKDLSNYVLTDAFSGFVMRTPFVRKKMEQWIGSKKEWTGRIGWQLLAYLAMKDAELPDEFFESHLEVIERDIHKGKNRVKDAMNSALIAIGMRNNKLKKEALSVAKKIGKVEVDHGETSCKTPDAAEYIRKASKRKK
ncbi:MAG: DNA alkylation repair protein [Blastocatellia bacterium]|nr:DNA alkylation repair protein [Blastocatellia bacterium]